MCRGPLSSPALLSPGRGEKGVGRATPSSRQAYLDSPPSRSGKGAGGIGQETGHTPPKPRNIVIGQHIRKEIIQRAKELKRQMTTAESLLWEDLRANRLGGFHFRRQQVIGEYIVDFYCHAAALVIELDGEVHQNQRKYDEQRDRWLLAGGFTVIRFSNQEVENSREMVLEKIRAACQEIKDDRS